MSGSDLRFAAPFPAPPCPARVDLQGLLVLPTYSKSQAPCPMLNRALVVAFCISHDRSHRGYGLRPYVLIPGLGHVS